ncbi:hypothetical protein Tco_1008507 [Tanacetum coccineum]
MEVQSFEEGLLIKVEEMVKRLQSTFLLHHSKLEESVRRACQDFTLASEKKVNARLIWNKFVVASVQIRKPRKLDTSLVKDDDSARRIVTDFLCNCYFEGGEPCVKMGLAIGEQNKYWREKYILHFGESRVLEATSWPKITIPDSGSSIQFQYFPVDDIDGHGPDKDEPHLQPQQQVVCLDYLFLQPQP